MNDCIQYSKEMQISEKRNSLILKLIEKLIFINQSSPKILNYLFSPVISLILCTALLLPYVWNTSKFSWLFLLNKTNYKIELIKKHQQRLKTIQKNISTISIPLPSQSSEHLINRATQMNEQFTTLNSERNYKVRHIYEAINEFSILLLGMSYTFPNPGNTTDTKTISAYWNRADSPTAKLKSLCRSLRFLAISR